MAKHKVSQPEQADDLHWYAINVLAQVLDRVCETHGWHDERTAIKAVMDHAAERATANAPAADDPKGPAVHSDDEDVDIDPSTIPETYEKG